VGSKDIIDKSHECGLGIGEAFQAPLVEPKFGFKCSFPCKPGGSQKPEVKSSLAKYLTSFS
jgi:hypothetical protein